MATFEFWYDESATYKAWFEADDMKHAEELLRQVNDGEIMFTDLPNVFEKQKGNDIEIDLYSLEEASE